MPAKMLNDTGVKAEIARVVQAKKRTDISDKGIRGLVLRITPTSSATFAFAYRPKGGRTTQRITIGSYPLVTLAKARQIALGYAQQVAVGKDIAGERRTAHAAAAREKVEKAARLTVAEAIERYLKLQVTRAATRRNFRNLYNSDVIPAIGGKAIADVTKADVQRIVDAIEDRGALRQAGLALAMVRSLLNWCVARGYLEASPIKGLKNPHASTAKNLANGSCMQPCTVLPNRGSPKHLPAPLPKQRV